MHVGLDVHKDFCQAAFVNAQGNVIREQRFENSAEGLAALAVSTKNKKVAMEASSSAFPVYDALSGSCTVRVAHPLKVKAIASARIKTDKIDARILAQLLRADLIPESYVPSKEQHAKRLLVRHRVALGAREQGHCRDRALHRRRRVLHAGQKRTLPKGKRAREENPLIGLVFETVTESGLPPLYTTLRHVPRARIGACREAL